ncbi:MAG TPA: hypothetical protein VFS36_01545 [Chitinophagaceae bacterium]|nr:hypothetical protein [Chitinophagaceae bacterium]
MTTRQVVVILITVFTVACQKDATVFQHANTTYRHDLHVGASCRDLVSDKYYKSLVIEMQYIGNYLPAASTIDSLEGMLNCHINKPGGISVTAKQIQPSDDLFSLAGIKGIEDRNRTTFTKGDTLAIYVLCLDGFYADDSLVLGAAYRNTSIVMFGKSVRLDAANSQTPVPELEATVLEHEFGHLMGLVDEGAPMIRNHRDTNHSNHCSNPDCLMYYEANDGYYLSQGGSQLTRIPVLDSACVADLRAIGGK